ncbi:MAG TPA: hypothetical protein VGD74_01315 [Vulgatibacter sp.]
MQLVGDVSPYGPLILDGDFLYFGTYEDIQRIRRDGTGSSQVQVSSVRMRSDSYLMNETAFAMDDGYFFWNHASPRGIHRSNRSRTGASLKITSEIGGVATDGRFVYFMSLGALTERPFSRVDRDGTNLVHLLEGPSYWSGTPNAFVLDESHAYVAFENRIERVPKAGGPAEIVVQGDGIWTNLLLASGDRIYWSNYEIQSVKKTGGARSSLATCETRPDSMAIEGGDLFWICGQSLYTKPISGGRERVLVDGRIANREHGFFSALAVDSDAVYYTEATGIMRLAR